MDPPDRAARAFHTFLATRTRGSVGDTRRLPRLVLIKGIEELISWLDLRDTTAVALRVRARPRGCLGKKSVSDRLCNRVSLHRRHLLKATSTIGIKTVFSNYNG